MGHQHLDLRGLRCPLPVIKLEKAMRSMSPGAELTLIADDPLAKIDIPHAANQAGFACQPLEAPSPEAFQFQVIAPKDGKDGA